MDPTTPPSDQKIFITGATGYLGSHVLDIALKKGYPARISVRDAKQAEAIIAKYPQFKDKLEYVVVPEIFAPNAFDGKLEGATGVIHVASPIFSEKLKSIEDDLLKPAVQGTLNILRTAANTKTVRRVVITSSTAAVQNPGKNTLTEEDWNPITSEYALASDNKLIGYAASKKLAEKTAWDFVEKEKPQFDIATIIAPFLYGPYVFPFTDTQDLSGSAKLIYMLIEDNLYPEIHQTGGLYVDVRDAALAHVLAIERPEAGGQRFLVSAGNYSRQALVDIVRKHFPNDTRADVGTPGVYPAPALHANNAKSRNLLGLTYRSMEDTFKDLYAQIAEFRRGGGVI